MTRHLGYKFVDTRLQRRGVQFVVGQWTDPLPDPVPCARGYHWCRSPRDLVLVWAEYGPVCLLVESEGPGQRDGTKTVSSRLYVHQVLDWNDTVTRLWAADCAEHVLPLFERARPTDKRPRAAIAAARHYAMGRCSDAARAAAGAAARATGAAGAAARAAGDAAGDAETHWQTDRLTAYLHGHRPAALTRAMTGTAP